MTRPASSLLFVPGDRGDRFSKAAHSGADRIILDLEDAVAPISKVDARAAVREWLAAGHAAVIRINSVESEWYEEDLRFLLDFPQAGVMIPKAEPGVVAAVAAQGGEGRELYPLVESVRGLLTLRQTAAIPGVSRIAFGNVDFALDSGISDTENAMSCIRTQIVLESKFAHLAPPIDGVSVALDDLQALNRAVACARQFGFGGKLCIHPKQVAVVNDAFTPTADQIRWAHDVLAAFNAGAGGAIALEGKMIDRPIVEEARRLLGAVRYPPACKGSARQAKES